MSRDSSHTYIHLHKQHHADLFDEFTSRNPLGAASGPSASSTATATHINPSMHAMAVMPINNPMPLGNTPQLAPEEILVAPHHQPPNPEDEDDVVPDQHAAFGITRAMAMRENQRANGDFWRDFGSLMERVRGEGLEGVAGQGTSQHQPNPLQSPLPPRQQSSQEQHRETGRSG